MPIEPMPIEPMPIEPMPIEPMPIEPMPIEPNANPLVTCPCCRGLGKMPDAAGRPGHLVGWLSCTLCSNRWGEATGKTRLQHALRNGYPRELFDAEIIAAAAKAMLTEPTPTINIDIGTDAHPTAIVIGNGTGATMIVLDKGEE
jgi:hypothetical protein